MLNARITINTIKSDLIIYDLGKKLYDYIESIDKLNIKLSDGSSLNFNKKKRLIRYLRIWLQPKGKSYQQNLMKQRISYIISAIKRSKTTDKQIRYIINHVLVSQIQYLITNYL